MTLKLKLSKRRAYFLDAETPAARLRVLKVLKPCMDAGFDKMLWSPHLCVTNVSRTGETLSGYVVRHSSAVPHFHSIEALKDVDCYGEVCYIGKDGYNLGEI